MTKAYQRTRWRPGAPGGALKQELYTALNSLPERDRVLIHALYWDNRSIRQAAKWLHISHTSARRRLQRILRYLRLHLDPAALFDPPTLLAFEAQVLTLAKKHKEEHFNLHRRGAPVPGFVRGLSQGPGHRAGWGAPTWRCGLCLVVHPVTERHCESGLTARCRPRPRPPRSSAGL